MRRSMTLLCPRPGTFIRALIWLRRGEKWRLRVRASNAELAGGIPGNAQRTNQQDIQVMTPPRAQTFEIETAQMHDLVLNRCLGRDTTVATLLPHRIRPPASRDRRTKPYYP